MLVLALAVNFSSLPPFCRVASCGMRPRRAGLRPGEVLARITPLFPSARPALRALRTEENNTGNSKHSVVGSVTFLLEIHGAERIDNEEILVLSSLSPPRDRLMQCSYKSHSISSKPCLGNKNCQRRGTRWGSVSEQSCGRS